MGSVLRVRRAGFIFGVSQGGVRLAEAILFRAFFPVPKAVEETEAVVEEMEDLLLALGDRLRAGDADSSSSVIIGVPAVGKVTATGVLSGTAGSQGATPGA